MNEWCKKTHGESGLVDRVASGIGEDELDDKLTEACTKYFGRTRSCWLATLSARTANSWTATCRTSRKSCTTHARREQLQGCLPDCYGKSFDKKGTHRALDDIRESIGEMRYYLDFVQPEKS